MRRLFLFEGKKVLKKKTTWAAFFLTIAAVIGLYFFNYSLAKSIQQGNIARLEYIIETFQKWTKDAEVEKKEAKKEGSRKKVKSLTDDIKRNQKSISKYTTQKENYINEDWHKLYKEQIPDLQYWIDNFDSYSRGYDDQIINNFTGRATLEEILLIDKNDVTPFIQNSIYTPYLPTIYDEFTGTVKEEWGQETKRYGTTGLTYIYQLIQHLYIPILILIGCFIFANNVSSDISNKKKGLNFYFVLPIHKKKLFIAKYLSGFIYTLGFVVFMLLVPLLCSLFTKGLGSFKYPVLIYEGSEPNPFNSEYNTLDPLKDQFHFINLSSYLLQALLLSIVLVIFLYSIYYVLSLFVRNPIVTAILVGIITFLGMKYPAAYNPFTYVDIHKVLNGETATLAFNPAIDLQNGIFVLLGVGCLMILLGYIRFSKLSN
ncbi:ABC transporter permease [Viridibacillus sp. FSL H7-0596]|uniref:ABC transporter permease subunit n=1 Tax=Viridibacillus sp. FSL H7-0596 TaxID=1928923 RepID=UPI00096EC6BB|nr:ABC transporter permease subunit [Viridibacillus sp. FSL H7-0596]OMC86486.1 ABC transporter permease [Viridibacillus sp. FSL H7-0596]